MSDPNFKQSHLIQTKPEKKSKYMVFVEGEGLPTVMHPDFKTAFAAASKLSEKFPDRKILVLHHCKTFQKRPPTESKTDE